MPSLVSDPRRLRVSLAQWKELSITHGFSTRRVKISVRDFYEEENFIPAKEFCDTLKIPLDEIVLPRQIHASHIAYIPTKIKEEMRIIPNCDGLLTRSRDIALGILSADCLPLLFWDPVSQTIGVAHAGWRGLEKQLPYKMVETFIRFSETRPQNLSIAIGPAIRQCCYEVGPDVAQLFPNGSEPKNGKFHLDLAAETRFQLGKIGIKPEQIADTQICTSCRNDEFFSYRREGELSGRILSVIRLPS